MSRAPSRSGAYTPNPDASPVHLYVPGNPRDPLDAEVAAIVNGVAHGLLIERVDPPLRTRDLPREGEENFMPLFVVLREGTSLDEELAKAIRTRIREDCSPRHVPNDIVAIAEVPRTLSGKVLELPVKKILQGGDPEKAASRDSLANPEALDFFVDYASRG